MMLAIRNEGNRERRVIIKKFCGGIIQKCEKEELIGDVCEEDVRMGGLVICDLLHDIDYG